MENSLHKFESSRWFIRAPVFFCKGQIEIHGYRYYPGRNMYEAKQIVMKDYPVEIVAEDFKPPFSVPWTKEVVTARFIFLQIEFDRTQFKITID